MHCPGTPIDVTIWVEPTPELSLTRQDVGGDGGFNIVFCSGLTTNLQVNSVNNPTFGIRFRYTIIPDSPADINFTYSADTFDLQKLDSIVDIVTNLSTDIQIITVAVTPYLIDPSGNPTCEGMTETKDYEITPPLIMLDSAKTYVFDTLHIDCHGNNSGVIYFNATGGITAYPIYNFDDLDYYFENDLVEAPASRDSVVDLVGGDWGNPVIYNIRAEDWSGCVEDTNIYLWQPEIFTSSLDQVVSVVCAEQRGIFEVVPSGGTYYYDAMNDTSYGYIVEWDEVGSYPYGEPYPNPLLDVSTGYYSWDAYDSNGCKTSGESLIIAENAKIQDFSSYPTYGEGAFETGISCYGQDDGQIYTRVQNSGLNLEFYLYTNTWQQISFGSGLQQTYYYNDTLVGPGLYYERVITPSGCVDTASYTLVEPDAISITDTVFSNANGFNLTCSYSEDGAITLNGVIGSHSNYEYLWQQEGATMLGENTNSITAVPAGNYTVHITSDDLCTDSFNFELTAPPEIIVTANVTNIDCYGDASGVIDLNSAGGIGSYEYSWEAFPGFTGSQLSGLIAGSYIYTVEDSVECFVTDTTELTQRPAITVDPNLSDYNGYEIACDNGANGSITVTTAGGTGDHSYTWNFEGIGIGGDTTTINGLLEGTYNLLITDDNACEFDTSYVLTAPAKIRITTTSYPKVCSSLGRIETNSITGGVSYYDGTYRLNWSNGSTDYSVIDLADGVYYITVTDANNCSINDSAIVELESSLEVDIMIRDSVQCAGYSNGRLGVDVLHGTDPLVAFWNGIPGDTSLNNVSAGEYILRLTDANECISYDTIQVTDPTLIEPVIDVIDAYCYDSADARVDFSATGSNEGFSYYWNDSLILGQSIENQRAGEYILSFVDRKQCIKNETVTIEQPEKIEILVYDEDISYPYCAYSDNGRIKVTVIGGIEPYSYDWIDQDAYEDTLSNIGVGEYTILVTDNNYCSMKRVIPLDPLLAACLDIPSAFTPNNDGFNETWVILDPSDENIPISFTYPDLVIEVFDRTGRRVWISSKGYTEPWNGKDKNGRILPVDSYYYFVHLNNGTGVVIQNIVTIIQ